MQRPVPGGGKSVRVIDSHTAGEPTRVIIEGGPDLGAGTMPERKSRFKREFDHFRSAVVNEPRGSDAMVGALLVPPTKPDSLTGVIFFNNVGYLGMCGHGIIGVMATLHYLGNVGEGRHRIETPAGPVYAMLNANGSVTVRNVPSYRLAKDVSVDVPGIGKVVGDVAWGGNWFFLVHDHGQDLSLANVDALTEYTWKIRLALGKAQITGEGGQEIDHIELFAPSSKQGVGSRNFVLCPGKSYDRSPCGTGTSAKMACLYADKKLQPGDVWVQESIVGSVFEGTIEPSDGMLIPTITGTAYVNADVRLILDERDPFEWGIRKR